MIFQEKSSGKTGSPHDSVKALQLRKLPVVIETDIPDGVGDLDEYEVEIEHLIDDHTETLPGHLGV